MIRRRAGELLLSERGDEEVTKHWFWLLITVACVVWYSTITVYVAIKGVADIKHMLARLAANHRDAPEEDATIEK